MSRPAAALAIVAVAGIGLAALAPPAGRCDDAYTVVRGDTLSRIARRCGSTVAAIAAASRIANPNLILVGQRLTIPGRSGMARAATPAPAPRPEVTAAGRLTYAMAPGDTLYSLARWSRVSVPALLAANPGVDPRRIEIGEVVRLPSGAAEPRYARLRERGPLPAAVQRAVAPADAPSMPTPARPNVREEREPVGM